MGQKITLHTWFQNNPIEVDIDGLTFELLHSGEGPAVTMIRNGSFNSCVAETPEQIKQMIGE